MYHTMTIAGVKRDLPLCPVTDELQIAAFVIFGDVGADLCQRQGAAGKGAGI